MELLAAYDPYVMLSLSLGLVLTLCVAILFMMRDPYAVPPHAASRNVWCAERRRSAHVDFVECVETGMVRRTVQRCSLRGPDGHCDEACRYTPI